MKAREDVDAFPRPRWHLTPPSGWMNDPNGPIRLDDRYHLYYQHNPDAPVWGNLHWGHASSTDLLHWRHEPIALRPDKKGQMFTGSVVHDTDGTAGFGEGALVAVFTQHLEGLERQSLAWSLDGGQTWTPYQDNPVLEAPPGCRDFRDPKVIAHGAGWLMVLAVGSELWWYRSQDLRGWEFATKMTPPVPSPQSIIEVPDLVRVPVEGTGTDVWTLIYSVEPPRGTASHPRHVHWLPGTLCDTGFAATPTRGGDVVDAGPVYYASLTWDLSSAGEPIAIGWMDERVAPDGDAPRPWCGRQSIPRRLSLVQREDSLVLRQRPVLPDWTPSARVAINAGSTESVALAHATFAARVTAGGAGDRIRAARLRLDSKPANTNSTSVSLGPTALEVRSSDVGVRRERVDADAGDLMLISDYGSLEVFADAGLGVASILTPVAGSTGRMEVENDGPDPVVVEIMFATDDAGDWQP
ncbi:MAG: glycoside hydrolase family 32 protein [Acidimicrobiaceae bacterium]|nr:glycoside hydrolase family 32 protein [Acidimicrobiaceae bacterium]MYI35287.1 glycoside hydrolase family 32 protein [Acidimicrobiaceae bacterium]